MLCCAMGIAAVATGAIGWRRFRRFLSWRLDAQSALAAVVVAMIAITITGLGHLRHHAAYAGDGQTLLTGLAPLCRGGAVADRITDIASTEE
jgi:hypothetical protein